MAESRFGAAARPLFALHESVAYLDNASVGPLPIAVDTFARAAVASKSQPWLRDREDARAKAAVLRGLAAAVIGARPQDMAITCAASYGLAVARRNLPLAAGDRVLVLQDDHTSQGLTWREHARRANAGLDEVPRPADGDWTAALLRHLETSPPPAIASLCATFWRDGTKIDLPVVCARLRALGCRIVLDLTQSAGIVDCDVRALDVDFAVFAMYKWLLGPYSLAFLYVHPRRQDGEPLEENGFNREQAGDYLAGAGRFDMGEKDTFVGIPVAIEALRFSAAIDRAALREHLGALTGLLGTRLAAGGIATPPAAQRSPHIIGVAGMPPGALQACREAGVFVTQRGSEVRVAPHLFNTEADIERCADVLLRCARRPG